MEVSVYNRITIAKTIATLVSIRRNLGRRLLQMQASPQSTPSTPIAASGS